MLNDQVNRARDEIDEMKKTANGRVGKVWDVRKKVLGIKKSNTEATVIMNPRTNKLVVSRKEIKEVTLEYCQKTLSNNIPENEFRKVVEDKKEEVMRKMNERMASLKQIRKHLRK